MLETKEVEINLTSSVINHYENLGYEIPRYKNSSGQLCVKKGTKIIVKVEDLPRTSLVKVDVQCDYCGKKHPKAYGKYLKSREIIEKDSCEDCSSIKQREVFKEKYGVTSPIQVEEFKNKIIEKTKAFNNIKDLQDEFSKKNCLLITTEYINESQQLEFICLSHDFVGIQTCTYSNFKKDKYCRFCGNEKIGEKLRFSLSYVKNKFDEIGYDLLAVKYINAHTPLAYRCRKHPKHIQYASYSNIFSNGLRCKFCSLENKYKDRPALPQSELFNFLRGKIIDWKKDSIKNCDYKCVLSKGKFNAVHHLYPFHKIVYETLISLNLPLHKYVNEYSNDELVEIIKICLEMHYNHGLGVCLDQKYHSFFHQIYGYSNTTEEDFNDFKQKFYNFEFDDLLEDKYKYSNVLQAVS
jgi:hypothetical protein